MKGCNPAAVVKGPSSPPIITITKFGWYLGTVPERIRVVRLYLSDDCDSLDDKNALSANGDGLIGNWAHRQTVRNMCDTDWAARRDLFAERVKTRDALHEVSFLTVHL
jgi:hypothetical protein